MTPPNILLITTDQQRADHIGLAGTPGLRTPNLDALGRKGVWFRRAYCPSPICTPTRVSLLTGRYPSAHGATSIGVTADPFPCPTLPELLKPAGYDTALFGKTHFVARQDEASHIRGKPGADHADFVAWDGPYLGFDHVQTSTGHTINCQPDMHYRLFLERSGRDWRRWFPQMTTGFPQSTPGYDHDRCGAWEIPQELHDTWWVAQCTEAWIRQHPAGRPWFAWASFQDPHEPFVCPEPWYAQVPESAAQPFPGPPAHHFADRPAFYGEALAGRWDAVDDGKGVPCVYRMPRRDERARAALRATMGMVNFIDDRIGSLLEALRTTGQLDHTLVAFTSDHGEMHGHHGFWGKGLTAFEDCQRVPLLVAGPGVAARGACDAIVNLVDLPRTFLNCAGVPTPQHLQGTDLSGLLRGTVDAVQPGTFIECQATPRIFQLSYVTSSHKLVVYRDSAEGELYDLAADPDQMTNLWSAPTHQAIKAGLMHEAMRERLRATGDSHPRKAFA